MLLVISPSPAPIQIASSNTAVATVTSTSTNSASITFVGAGTSTITASQTAVTGFAAASASTTLTVDKAQQTTLVLTTLTSTPGTPVTLASTGGTGTGTTTYQLSQTSTDCTLEGTVLNRATPGTCTVIMENPGDANHHPTATTATVSFVWVMHGDVSEGQTLTLNAPNGMVFSSVVFASYGTPTGTGGNYSLGDCHAADSTTIVSNSALAGSTVSIDASNDVFGDPCGGTGKRLAVSLGLSLRPPDTATRVLLYEVTNPRRVSGTIRYSDGLGTAAGHAAATFDTQGRTIARVIYRMEVLVEGTMRYAEVAFNPWSGVSASGLRIPDGSTGHQFMVRQVVENMTVTSNMDASASAKSHGVTVGSQRRGYLEIWPSNYSEGAWADGPTGSRNDRYDFNDGGAGTGAGYGSFQVHDVTVPGTGSTVLAWNAHDYDHPAIGLGTQITDEPDWTYAGQTGLGAASWRLQISVEPA